MSATRKATATPATAGGRSSKSLIFDSPKPKG